MNAHSRAGASAIACFLITAGTMASASVAIGHAHGDVSAGDSSRVHVLADTVQSGQVDADGVTHSGSLWRKVNSDTTGAYQIVVRDGQRLLTFESGFRVDKKAPDLKVVLSPLDSSKATNRNALSGALILGLLPSTKGAAEFVIPEGTDLSRFRSVLIHCEQYTKLWSAAPLAEGEIVASSDSWSKKSNKVTGAWEIARITEPAQDEDSEDLVRHVIRFGSEFSTRNAPDLKVVLSPLSTRDAKNTNALRGGRIVAPLRSNKGAQSYDLPEGIDLSDYRSVLIHCEQFTKLWAASAISR